MKGLQHGDSLELLPELEDSSVDLVLTDPPYNISEGKDNITGLTDFGRGAEGIVFNNYGDWDEGHIEPSHWLKEAERVLKESGVFISFYDPLKMDKMKMALEEVGFEYFSKYYWFKTNPAPRVRANILMPAIEETWMAAKGGGGSHYINEGLRQNHSAVKAPLPSGGEYTEHPTQKPTKVMRRFIRYHCPPDGLVLDPFAGSGTTAIAAEQLGRDWIAIEKEEEYVDIARDRISKEGSSANAMEVDWA